MGALGWPWVPHVLCCIHITNLLWMRVAKQPWRKGGFVSQDGAGSHGGYATRKGQGFAEAEAWGETGANRKLWQSGSFGILLRSTHSSLLVAAAASAVRLGCFAVARTSRGMTAE